MSDAAWKPDRIVFIWGPDAEGRARGFSWCSLCGKDCPIGVVAVPVPHEPRGNAFFCGECVEKMVATKRGGDA